MRKSLPRELPDRKTHQDSEISHRMNMLKMETLAKTTARNKNWKGKNAVTWMVCLCSLNTFTLTTALLNSGFKD